jgi:hypothetical protein
VIDQNVATFETKKSNYEIFSRATL